MDRPDRGATHQLTCSALLPTSIPLTLSTPPPDQQRKGPTPRLAQFLLFWISRCEILSTSSLAVMPSLRRLKASVLLRALAVGLGLTTARVLRRESHQASGSGTSSCEAGAFRHLRL